MAATVRRIITFNRAERKRIGKACQVLGIHFEEFVHDAAMQAVDEVLGINDEVYRGQHAGVPTDELRHMLLRDLGAV